MDEFTEIVKKLYRNGYSQKTVIKMVKDIFGKYGELPLVFAGGVMSNSIIREIITSRFNASFAEPEFSCDNAAGLAVFSALKKGLI